MERNRIEQLGFENVYEFLDDDFHAYIAIHSTRLGPALGGCRLYNYPSDADALADALRLAKSMTHKNSAAGLDFGGGKGVINAPKSTREILLKFGEAVESLSGAFITAEDVGTTIADIAIIGEKTSHLVTQDGSPATALGVFECIQAARTISFLDEAKLHVWVQGLGKVGWELVHLLDEAGYEIWVSDLIESRVVAAINQFHAHEYWSDFADDIDVYAPCAMGGIITSVNVNEIRFPIICGSANNQLADDSLADRLHQNGVLYCPDFVVSSGGVIAAAGELSDQTADETDDLVRARGEALLNAIRWGDREHRCPLYGAMILAGLRLV
jgi:leucine dehydrogenase